TDDEDNNEAEENEEDLNSSSDSESNSNSREVSESEEKCDSDQNEWAERESLSTVMEEELKNILPVHIRCASHTLNLVATTDAMVCIKSSKSLESNYNKMIDRCSSLLQLLSAPKKAENAKSILGKSLKRPVATRWNSLYDSLIQIFSLKEKILNNVQALEMTKPLKETDFRFIEEYCRCHQPIAQAIDVLQGDQIASYGYLLPTLIMTRKRLLACKDLKFHYCQKLVSGLIGAVEKRFKNIFAVVDEGRTAAVAAACHPMFKLRWLSSLNNSAQDNVMKAIQEAIEFFCDTPVDQSQTLPAGAIDDFFDFDDQPLNTDSNSITPKVNFIKFTTKARTDFQILNSYPIVREIFLKTNTILPPSAPVERLFSYATMCDLPKYTKLSDK
ncbi:GSCOCG00011329001-RA-CDS, partial [Cotesia congregata]